MKNLNFTINALKNGGYIAEYQNYVTQGYRGVVAGVALMNKDGKCLLSEVSKEFSHIKDKLNPVEWSEGPYSGTEWYWRES